MTARTLPNIDEDFWTTMIRGAVREALRHEDHDRFIEWLRSFLTDTSGFLPPQTPAEMIPRLAAALGRALWNAIPLPGSGYRPRRLPKPERNQPCPCGSGEKYKRCCGNAPAWPEVEPDEIWAIALEEYSDKQLKAAIAARALPAHLYSELAQRELEAGRPQAAVRLLEPLFGGELQRLDGRYDPALNRLCDAYEALGAPAMKLELLQRAAADGGKALRSAAWQRLATWHCDRGEHEETWAAFREAQRASPDDPSVAMLEVTLLIAEARSEEARERAQVWLKRFERDPDVAPQFLEWLEDAVRDPAGKLTTTFIEAVSPLAERLRDWLDQHWQRPLPRYTLARPAEYSANDPDALRGKLEADMRAMGVDPEANREHFDRVIERLLKSNSARSAEPEPDGDRTDDEFVLVAPANLVEVEAAWHRAYPVGKPFSVSLEPLGSADPWEPEVFSDWFGFLEQQPRALESLDVLDDLATAFGMAWEVEPPWVLERVTLPLLDQASAIIEAALVDASPTARLPWLCAENRPALRLLARRLYALLDLDRRHEAHALTQRLLQINPNDNHGFRGLLMNELLDRGEDAAALELVARYPDDVSVELAFGQVLALYRLGRRDEAQQALRGAQKEHRYGAEYLWREQPEMPQLNPDRVSVGGKDEAWLYREAMRHVWLAVPGVMDWLRREAR